MQRDDVFWTGTAMVVFFSILQGAVTMLAQICEAEGLWTIRFYLGRYEHLWWTGTAAALVTSMGAILVSCLAGNPAESLGILALSTASSLVVFRCAWPAWRNRHFCRNRWAAWTGPSRTGIDSTLVQYIGGPENWKNINSKFQIIWIHPVERRPRWFFRSTSRLIAVDPTDLLKAEHASSKSNRKDGKPALAPSISEYKSPQPAPSSTSLPGVSFLHKESFTDPSQISPGLYAPVIHNQSASLLWGTHLGFASRVSRGILSMPRRLLSSYPRTEADHDGRPICLAHGILARNKGLSAWTFILDLNLRKFEEKSVQWPRPSKVLRSYYKKEMENMYGGFGDAYVKAATELALLLADTHYGLFSDWLDARLEQQDLALNRRLHELGASPEDLQLLYRLSYAAMLVSLSSHVRGHHLRPEMSIFTAYIVRIVGRALPEWAMGSEIQERLVAERSDLTIDLDALIESVLPPYQ